MRESLSIRIRAGVNCEVCVADRRPFGFQSFEWNFSASSASFLLFFERQMLVTEGSVDTQEN